MPQSNLISPQKRYSAYTGFVTTPRYFDDSVHDSLTGEDVAVHV